MFSFVFSFKLKEDEIQLPVFLMVRREKLTIFIDAFENTKVIDILIMLQCIVKKAAEDMRLMKENQVNLSDDASVIIAILA